ncbi:MAG: LAGLIDADG family homing endonuclease [Candidatus Aenigmatarchaeota archaeon]
MVSIEPLNVLAGENIYVRNLGNYVTRLIRKVGIQYLENQLKQNRYFIYSWQQQGIPIRCTGELWKHYECFFHRRVSLHKARYALPKSSNALVLPDRMTPELAYVTGYLIGDGTIASDLLRVEFYDASRDHLLHIASLIKRLFDLSDFKLSKDNIYNCYCLRYNSKLLALFFSKVMEIPIGKKKMKLKIPSQIDKPSFVKSFISGFTDAEGHVYYTPRLGYRVSIVQSSNIEFLSEIMVWLKHFRIDSEIKHHYRPHTHMIEIRRKDNVQKFLSCFDLKHPDKVERAHLLLRGLSTVRRTRLSQVKKDIIRHLQIPLTSLELSEILMLKRKTIWLHLRELENRNLIIADRSIYPIRWSAQKPP